MSLRKSPTLTPALLAATRRNAAKSTGPRTARGKAWSCLNHMKHGGRSREYVNLLKVLLEAPPGRVAATADALLASMPALHPLFIELAELCIQGEIDICAEFRRISERENEKKNSFFDIRSRNVIENKQNGNSERSILSLKY